MDELRRQEYLILRDTIRQRGMLRAIFCWASIVAWAAVATAVGAKAPIPIAWMVPLVVLAAGLETINGIHVGVERIGRYIQVFYEERGEGDVPPWETVAMEYGKRFPGGGGDPLASELFMIAGFFNLTGLLVCRITPLAAGVLAIPHLIFFGRVLLLRRQASSLRATDLARFRQLKAELAKRES